MFNRDALAARKQRGNRRYKTVTVGGEEYVLRSLNLLERDAFNLSVLDEKGKLSRDHLPGTKARLIALCVVETEGGQPWLSEKDVVEAFDIVEIDELHKACTEMNGLATKAVEAASGNS